MASGIEVKDECKTAWEDMHNPQKRSYKFIVFKIVDYKFIDIEKLGDADATFNDFLDHLSGLGEGEARYGIFKFNFEDKDRREAWKNLIIKYVPESCGIKDRMVYQTSYRVLMDHLNWSGDVLEANNMAEASHDSIMKKIGY